MTAINRLYLPASLAPDALWPALAEQASQWLAGRDLGLRDAVLLLPSTDLLAPARQAFAARGGWQPRIETPRTLAASLGPPPPPAADAPSGDVALDRLGAAAWLAQLPMARDWRRRDPASFDQALLDVVATANALASAAADAGPLQRVAWWARARQLLDAGSAGLDAMLARVALEWAALGGASALDRLWALQPSAWLSLVAGGEDRATAQLFGDAAAPGRPCLALHADPADSEFNPAAPRLSVCADAESEAWATAAAVIEALRSDHGPVILVAEDRLLVRRVRALLERAGLRIADESGWTLNTTRAGALVHAVLRAAQPSSGPDAWLDALKAEASPGDGAALDRLEAQWRRHGPQPGSAGPAAEAWWQAQRRRWQSFAAPREQALAGWQRGLRACLSSAPNATHWQIDPAARSVWQALALDAPIDAPGAALTLAEFVAWADTALSEATYVPAMDRATAQVLITPLARAILRPCGSIVLPGADARHLGPAGLSTSLLSQAQCRALGLPERQSRTRRGQLAFTQLLRHPRVHLLRRAADGAEPLGPSPWVAALQCARQAQGLAPLIEQPAVLPMTVVQPAPVARPLPVAAGALPAQVSASAVEALRACPYRFYARSVLRLAEIEELEADPDKREYGSLLHAALHAFHEQRDPALPAAEQQARLIELADALAQERGLDGPPMLPFRAGLPAFATRYLRWLQARESQGWHYRAGEWEQTVDAPGIPGLALRGIIDRIDQRHGAQQLIDYKTGSLATLKQRVREPLEDTQLAFYAAQLLAAGPAAVPLQAAYLALDDREAIVELAHPQVEASARALLAGLAADWSRLNTGAPLRALGEGEACTHCEARGLCRRDHWSGDQVANA